MQAFRLIVSPPMTGAENMALDEALLESVSAGKAPPTLRLYAWNPPCLSLGYAQSAGDVDQQALLAAGWELVRRPTGGKAILHTDELTYAVAGPTDQPLFQESVLVSYRRLSAGLLAGLRLMGLQPELQSGSTPNGDNPICFQVPGAYELTVRGMKLLGSAQLRRAGGVLQHGSLPLGGDIGRICRALRYSDDALRQAAAAEVRNDATTVERVLGHPVDWDQAAQAMAAGFAEGLRLELQPGEPTAVELEQARQLQQEKYGNPDWNLRQ